MKRPKKLPRDPCQLAKTIVDLSTAELPAPKTKPPVKPTGRKAASQPSGRKKSEKG